MGLQTRHPARPGTGETPKTMAMRMPIPSTKSDTVAAVRSKVGVRADRSRVVMDCRASRIVKSPPVQGRGAPLRLAPGVGAGGRAVLAAVNPDASPLDR